MSAPRTAARVLNDKVLSQAKGLLCEGHPLKWDIYRRAAIQEAREQHPGMNATDTANIGRRAAFRELRDEHRDEYDTIVRALRKKARQRRGW